MAQLLLTLIGEDREGLVSALSSVVAEHDGNWLESQMARLGGMFAGVALVDVPDEKVEALTAAVGQLGDLRVEVTEAGTAPEVVGTPVVLHVVGNDRSGIVSEVSRALASKGVGIDEMHSSTRPAPMADTTLFEATAQVRLPEGVDVAEVREALEAIATELMVDLDFDESLEE